MRRKFLLTSGLGAVLFHSAASAAIIAGNLTIVQNDPGNTAASVSGSFGYAQGNVSYVSGSRGDFDIRFDGATPADDIANGIMIVSIAENGRSNEGGTIGAGPGYATAAIQANSAGGYASSINIGASAVSGVAAGGEWNSNQSVGYFKYSDFVGGWITNSVNNGAMTSLASSSIGMTIGSGDTNTGYHVFDSTLNSGTYSVNLTSFIAPGTGTAASSQNGILLVVGGRNEANHATSRANADGTFDVFTRDSSSGSGENDGAAFVYIPTGQPGVVAMGRVDGDGNVVAASGDFTVTKGGTGQWFITTTGYDPSNSTLLVSGEGGTSLNSDNIVSSRYNEVTHQWEVESRDIPSATTSNPALQNLPGEYAFSFIIVPEPSSALLGLAGLCLALRRRR